MTQIAPIEQLQLEEEFLKLRNTWHIRLKNHKTINIENTVIMIKELDPDCSYIVSAEGAVGTDDYHNHVLVSFPKLYPNKTKTNIRKNKDLLSKLIKETYTELYGNRHLSCEPARTPSQLAKYVVKDEDYVSHGFTQKFINNCIKLSFSVKKQKDIMIQLKEQVILKNINLTEYSKGVLSAKASLLQPIYENHHVAHIRSMGIKIGTIDVKEYNDHLMDKVWGVY